MSILKTIPLELSIVLGSADIPIRQMLKMSRGSMIPLNCGQDAPSTVFVNNQPVALGQIQITGDRMSLEVTELVRRTK